MSGDRHAHRRRLIGVLLHRWHRRLGAVAGAFLIWLAASGIILNHSASLGLDHTKVSAPWLTRMYGLHEVIPKRGFITGAHWLVGTDAQTVVDAHLLSTALPGPLGLAAADHLLYAANASEIVILDMKGHLVDTLTEDDLPVPGISRIGHDGGVVVISDARGRQFASRDGVAWTAYRGTVTWSASQPLPASVRTEAAPFLRPKLPLERVLLDAHSGRILGHYGPLLVDLIGIFFLLIGLSGLWMFLRHQLRQRRHPHPAHEHTPPPSAAPLSAGASRIDP
jgi:hypothetical protein